MSEDLEHSSGYKLFEVTEAVIFAFYEDMAVKGLELVKRVTLFAGMVE